MQVGISEAVVHVEDRREYQLDVRRGPRLIGFEEGDRLGHVRRERAFFEEEIIEDVFYVVGSVKSYRFAALVFDSDQQVIHQVLTDAWQVGDDGDVHRAQVIGG